MTYAPKIVFLNGPKEVGKTTIANALSRCYVGKSLIVAHADPLAWATAEMFWSSGDMIVSLKDAKIKRGPLPGFDHVVYSHLTAVDIKIPYTVRDWLVALGHFTRKELGEDALSRILLRRMIENEGFIEYFIVEGTRTNEDIEAIVKHYGATNCLVVRLFREGHTFEGDLGYYIETEKYPDIPFLDLHNDGTVEDAVNAIVEKLDA